VVAPLPCAPAHQQILQYQPERRISAERALQHPYFADIQSINPALVAPQRTA